MLNPFFLQGSKGEQGLVQDLINEQLKIYGVDVYYLPREYATEKTVIKEVVESKFSNAYPLEAYVDTYDGYGGQGTLLSKFGIQEVDDLTLIISKERYENYIQPLIEDIPNTKLYASIDSWGKKAEYMRHGLDIILWEKNLRTVLSAGFEVMLMCTYNALAVSSFTSLLEKIVEWRKEYGFDSIRFDAPYLRTPEFWAINILPSDFDIFIKDSIKFIENNKTYFRDDEYDRMKRLLTYKQEYPFTQTELMIYKKDFYTFFTTNDKRLDTSFSDTFPEYQSFLDTCKKGDI